MTRDKPREQRSIWLTMLAILFMVNGLGALLFAFFPLVRDVVTRTIQFANDPNAVDQSQPSIDWLPIIAGGAGGLICLAIGYLLLRRFRPAYGMAALVQLVIGGVAVLFLASNPAEAFGGGSLSFLLGVLVGLVGFVVPAVLFAFSFRDFVGGLKRFIPAFTASDHATHYNAGVGYKDRGMWYMAMREWEMAVARAPFDLNYLHALGLAYAQVGRYERARTTLQRALAIAHGHRQITESVDLVERMAQAADA